MQPTLTDALHGTGHTLSLWQDTARLPSLPPLERDLAADVCVVGAGWAGLMTAYRLIKEGMKVIVLDKESVGAGESARTTAHLAVPDKGFAALRALHGERGAETAAASHAAAISYIEDICLAEGIDCGFERLDGYLFLSPGRGADALEAELVAARAAGLEVDALESLPWDFFRSGPCLRFPRQAQLHPVRFMTGLTQSLARAGAALFGGTRVVEVAGGPSPMVRTAAGPTVKARSVVVATNAPINDRGPLSARQAAYRTYVVACRVPRRAVPKALYWDMEEPFHYVRLFEDWVITGAEDHKTGHDRDPRPRWARVEAWARRRFPFLGERGYSWSGQIQESADGLAYIGRRPNDPDNLLVVTGDSGNGLTHGAIAALILGDLILGRPNAWASLYRPGRLRLGGVPETVRENARAFGALARYLSPAAGSSPTALLPGTGAILRRGLRKRAVSRDLTGRICELTRVCPHFGGQVQWNPAERTWDCPLHGSRFAPDGSVLCGPARTPLRKV